MRESLLLLIAIWLIATNSMLSSNGVKPASKYWLMTCKDCGPALQLAVDLKCNNERQCSSLVNEYYPDCVTCTRELVDPENLETVDSSGDFLFCDERDAMQVVACQYLCRVMFYTTGKCQREMNRPLCKCSYSDQTTTEATTTISGEVLHTLKFQGGDINALKVLPNGRLASASGDSSIKVYNTSDFSKPPIQTLAGHMYYVRSLELLPDGNLASGAGDYRVFIWNTAGDNDGSLLKILAEDGELDQNNALAALPGGLLACADSNDHIKIWSVDEARVLRKLVGHTGYVTSLAVLANGDLASGSMDKTIKIWDVAAGSTKATFKDHQAGVLALALLPGTGQLVSASVDKTVKVWNTATGLVVRTLSGHRGSVSALAVFPNGNVASGSHDKSVRIWNVSDGSELAELNEHENNVISLAVLPNGDLASGSTDNTIIIWNTKS